MNEYKPGELVEYELIHDKGGFKKSTNWLECVFLRYQGKRSARVAIPNKLDKEKTVLLHKLRKKNAD